MIRKFTVCLMTCLTVLLVSSCKDEAPSPPKPSFTVNATSGTLGVTEFTFTINQVSADAITLFPYGVDHGALGTVLIDPASFSGNQAIVKFKYGTIGTWQAVVQSNNHSGDGKSVKNTQSDPVTITITNNLGTLSNFTLADTTKNAKSPFKATNVDTSVPGNITVTMPYGTDVTKLTASFTTEQGAVVTVNGTAQKSGKGTNNFTSPVTYTVKSSDGTSTKTYLVTVNVTPVETYKGLKTVGGKLTSAVVKGRTVSGYADSVNNVVVIYDTLGSPANRFDSVRFEYATTGSFATVKYGTAALKQDSLLDLSTNNKQITVAAQDGTTKVYTIYALQAPKLWLSFEDLNPVVDGSNSDFNITMNVLKQSNKHYNTYYSVDLPANTTLVSVQAGSTAIASGDDVNFAKPVTFWVTVHNSTYNIDYTVAYTASLKEN